MILRLSGADFSAKNIGKINIRSTIDYDTELLLSKYTRELTADQQFAVDDFLLGLKEHGIWDSISFLYLPLLAGKLSECGINAKTFVQDFTPDENYYQLSAEHGIESIESGSNIPANNRMKILFNGSQMNYHWAWMPLRAYDSTQNEGLGYFADSNAQRRLITALNSSGTNQTSVAGTLNGNASYGLPIYPTFNSEDTGMDLITWSCGTDGISGYGYTYTGEYIVGAVEYKAGTEDATYTDETTYILNSNSNGIFNSYGLVSLGIDLTDEQLIAYYNLASALKDALAV